MGIVRFRLEGFVPYYSLSEDAPLRAAVRALAQLTPNERRYLMRHWVVAQSCGSNRERSRLTDEATGASSSKDGG